LQTIAPEVVGVLKAIVYALGLAKQPSYGACRDNVLLAHFAQVIATLDLVAKREPSIVLILASWALIAPRATSFSEVARGACFALAFRRELSRFTF
jgi:hypothetical protein